MRASVCKKHVNNAFNCFAFFSLYSHVYSGCCWNDALDCGSWNRYSVCSKYLFWYAIDSNDAIALSMSWSFNCIFIVCTVSYPYWLCARRLLFSLRRRYVSNVQIFQLRCQKPAKTKMPLQLLWCASRLLHRCCIQLYIYSVVQFQLVPTFASEADPICTELARHVHKLRRRIVTSFFQCGYEWVQEHCI